jgi:chromosomal replication initiator protein
MIYYTSSRNPPLKPVEFRIFSNDLGVGIVGSFPKGRMTVACIQAEVADFFDVPTFEMRAARRSKSVVHARHIAMYLARELTPKSYPEIGRMFGDRDHTTVMHAVKRVERLCATDAKAANDVAALRERLAA